MHKQNNNRITPVIYQQLYVYFINSSASVQLYTPLHVLYKWCIRSVSIDKRVRTNGRSHRFIVLVRGEENGVLNLKS